jgi:hypothetical protein
VHHPWRAIRALTDWQVVWTHGLPAGVDALTYWDGRTIWVRHGMSQVQRRCIIEHERQHVLRGPGGVVEVEERAVDIAAARALIKLEHLIDAARWARSMPELADELHVTEHVLHARLMHLHPSERAAMRRALDEDDEQAVS